MNLITVLLLFLFNTFVGWTEKEQNLIQQEIDNVEAVLGFNPIEGRTIYHLSPNYPYHSCWSTLVCFGDFSYTEEKMQGLITHEIGHILIKDKLWSDLEYSLGYVENGEYIHVSGTHPKYKKFIRTDLGFYLPEQPYCQNCSYIEPYGQYYKEDFADMFMAYVMGWLKDDPAGKIRQEFMKNWIEGEYNMISKERTKLIRALNAIASIPLPQSGLGASSMSLQGIYDYQNDMRAAIRHINNIKYALVYREPIDDEDVKALEILAHEKKEE